MDHKVDILEVLINNNKMVDDENFRLLLNEFEENVKTSWQELQNEKDFCDVPLACEDKPIQLIK